MHNDTAQATGAVAIGEQVPGKKVSIKAKAIDETKRFLLMSFYLWVLFAVLNLHKTVVLAQDHINYEEWGLALVNALVLAKVMLVAEDLKLGSRFKHRPLIYSVLWSSFVFSVVLIGFHIVEHGAMALLHGKPLSNSLADFGAGNLKGVLSFGAIGFVTLIPFFVFRDLGRVLGSDQLWQLVFASGHKRFTLVAQG